MADEKKPADNVKVDAKKAEGLKKDFSKVSSGKKKDPTGRGISMKNWIFIVVALIIAFGAGYYCCFFNSQAEIKSYKDAINEYKSEMDTLQQKQDLIQNLLKK